MPQIVAWETHERMRRTRVLNAVMQHNAGALNECARVRQRVHVEIAIAIKRERGEDSYSIVRVVAATHAKPLQPASNQAHQRASQPVIFAARSTFNGCPWAQQSRPAQLLHARRLA